MVAVPSDVEGEEAELISPEITIEKKVDLCLSFMFVMIGNGNGELRVSMRHANGATKVLWLSFDDQSNKVIVWVHIAVVHFTDVHYCAQHFALWMKWNQASYDALILTENLSI